MRWSRFALTHASLKAGPDGVNCDYAALSTLAVGFSDDGFGVQDEDAMAEIMREIAAVDSLVAQHMEDLEALR